MDPDILVIFQVYTGSIICYYYNNKGETMEKPYNVIDHIITRCQTEIKGLKEFRPGEVDQDPELSRNYDRMIGMWTTILDKFSDN
jgi:hypothetical protein